MKEQLIKLQNRLDEIAGILGEGEHFDGIKIDEGGIEYHTYDEDRGCGRDYFYFVINWDELEKDITYFMERKALEIQKVEKQKIAYEKSLIASAKREEKRQYKRLKKKFEGK